MPGSNFVAGEKTLVLRVTSPAIERIRRLISRKPFVTNLPVFDRLSCLQAEEDVGVQSKTSVLDSIVALWLLINWQSSSAEEYIDCALDRIVERIQKEGGHSLPPEQLVDFTYESVAYLHLIERVNGISFPTGFRDGEPDLRFNIEYQSSGKMSTLHLECKNIREDSNSIDSLTKRVVRAIESAQAQVGKRKLTNADEFVVFIDLPAAFGNEQSGEKYLSVASNVLSHFSSSNTYWFDPGRVIYTATFQSDMVSLIEAYPATIPQVFAPVVTGGLNVYASRAILLSSFFRLPDENANCNNFMKRAIVIEQSRD